MPMISSRLFAAGTRGRSIAALVAVFALLGVVLAASALAQSLPQTSGMLSGTHIKKSVACAGCHADVQPPEPVAAATCIGCHDVDEVVAKTADVKPTNPHTSPHYGKKADCNLCHHQHEASENYCLSCHNFQFKVP